MLLYFDSSYHADVFSVHRHFEIADRLYLQVKPQNFIQCTPRLIKDNLCFWKAMEFQNCSLYYSFSIFGKIVDSEYFNRYLLLVNDLCLLYQKVVKLCETECAEKLLIEYVKNFETLYTLHNTSVNVHYLLHLPLCVKTLNRYMY